MCWLADPHSRRLYTCDEGLREVEYFTAGELALEVTADQIFGMINGAHVVIHSTDAEAGIRAFFRDILGFCVGGRWSRMADLRPSGGGGAAFHPAAGNDHQEFYLDVRQPEA